MLWSSACDGEDAATTLLNEHGEKFDSWECLTSSPPAEEEDFYFWECLSPECGSGAVRAVGGGPYDARGSSQ